MVWWWGGLTAIDGVVFFDASDGNVLKKKNHVFRKRHITLQNTFCASEDLEQSYKLSIVLAGQQYIIVSFCRSTVHTVAHTVANCTGFYYSPI